MIAIVGGLIFLGLAWVGGALYEGCRRGGTLDLEQRVALAEAELAELQDYVHSTPLRHLIPTQERRR